MKISELIRRDCICLDLTATSKNDASQQVAQLAKGHPNLGDFPSFCRAIYERELTGSTSIGYGVAIPHARTEQVKDLLLVVGRLNQGVQFEPTDETPVRLIFLVGTPKRMVTEYLRLVGTLARHLKTEALRDKLLQANDAETLIKAFIESESATP
jgi:mannitol/fructose-specific phosphotransferase system IIA component (Ntr-type)